MNAIILISEKYLKDFSSFDSNVDTKLTNSSIAYAQELYIMPVLGTDLYNEILTQYSAGTLSTANSNLLNNYIKPALAAYTIYETSDFLVYKFSNKGIMKEKSDTSDPISLSELQHFKGKLLSTAQFYGEKLIKYLMGNTTTYPLYLSGNNTIDKYRPNGSNIQGNIYIPKGGVNCSRYFGYNN